MIFDNLVVILILMFNMERECSSVEITKMLLEDPVVSGEGTWLRCEWDENGDRTYALKWYWGQEEFYRWTPRTRKPMLQFPVEAFRVDSTKSSKGNVFIRNVSLLATTRIFRCEVSGEGPTFATDFMTQNLEVIDLPDSQPVISGEHSPYQIQDKVNLKCISPGSKPAAELQFYINGEPAEKSFLRYHKPYIVPGKSVYTSTLDLVFPLTSQFIRRRNRVRVKCAAKIKGFYWESTEVELRVDVPMRDASTMDHRDSRAVSRGSNSNWNVSPLHFTVIVILLSRIWNIG